MFRTVIILVLSLAVLSTSMPQSGGTEGQGAAAGTAGTAGTAGSNGGQQGPGGFPNFLHGFNQFLNGNGTEGGVLGLPIKIFQGGLNGLQGGINGILGG